MPSANNQFFTALRTGFLAFSPLTALVGNRVARGMARQGESLPLVAMHLLGEERQHTHDAPYEGTERTSRVQFDCDALTPSAADEVAEQVSAAIDNLLLTSGLTATFHACTHDDSYAQDFQSPAATNQSAAAFARQSLTYSITYKPT